MPEKQLTPEQEKLQEEVRKEAEKEGLPQKDIEELAELAGVVGGMSKTARRILIDSTIALGGAALGAAALYGGQRLNKWHKERNEKPAATNTNTATNAPKLVPGILNLGTPTHGTPTPRKSSNIDALDLATLKNTIPRGHTIIDELDLTPPTYV